jgi:hypothetical protein
MTTPRYRFSASRVQRSVRRVDVFFFTDGYDLAHSPLSIFWPEKLEHCSKRKELLF